MRNWNCKVTDGFLDLSNEGLQAIADVKLRERCAYYGISTENLETRFQVRQHRQGQYAKPYNSTHERYDSILRLFYAFCAETGDWDSMLLLLFPKESTESVKCPAMRMETLCNFVRFKINPEGTPLLNGNNGDCDPVLLMSGEQVVSGKSQWKAPKNITIFGSAIANIHKTHKHSGAYMEACSACASAANKACDNHVNSRLACWCTQGNPIESGNWKANKRTLSDPNYEPNGCSQIDPGDVRDIRDFLLAQNTLQGLKMLVMILLAVKIFLRADEVITIREERFLPSLFFVVNGIVRSLGVAISGKAEGGQLLYFNIWRDFDHPDICAVIHLLVYIYKANIRGGFLFPLDRDLAREDVGQVEDGYVYVKHESYKCFLRAMKKVSEECLEEYSNDKVFRVSTHIFRKAAYCFRIWAYYQDKDCKGVDYVKIKFDARHAKDSDAMTYIRDAAQHHQYSNVAHLDRLKVSAKEQMRISSLVMAEKNCKRFSDHGTSGKTLYDIAKTFVYSLPCDPEAGIRKILEVACRKPSQEHQAQKQLVASMNAQQLEWYTTMRNHENQERINQKHEYHKKSSKRPTSATAPSSSSPTKRPKSSGEDNLDDLDLRHQWKKKKTAQEKIDLLVTIEKQCSLLDPLSTNKYTRGAKKWVLTTMRPALNCFHNHCDSSGVKFASVWEGKMKADFGKLCCKGADCSACGGGVGGNH